MIQVLWWNDCTLHQILHLKTAFYVFARVTHVNDWMPDRKHVIFADVGKQTHDIAILNRFVLIYLIVEMHGLGWTPLQGISSI